MEAYVRQIWDQDKRRSCLFIYYVAAAAFNQLQVVVCTFLSVTRSHVKLLAQPRTLYLTWIILLQIATAENTLRFSRIVSLFCPPARLASDAACRLFTACLLPIPDCPLPSTSLWFTCHLHWVNFWGKKGALGLRRTGEKTKEEWGFDELRLRDAIFQSAGWM